MAKIDAFFNLMDSEGASDLHLAAGSKPILRVRGEMERVTFPELENDDLKSMLYEIAPEYKVKIFEETGDVDFGYEIPGKARYRANFFNQKNTWNELQLVRGGNRMRMLIDEHIECETVLCRKLACFAVIVLGYCPECRACGPCF